MPRTRTFSPVDQHQLLEALRVCRHACNHAMRDMPITGDAGANYRATSRFLAALDAYAMVLTGNREALLDPRHSDPVKPG